MARSANKNPGIKRPYFPLPAVIEPDGVTCIKIPVPDHPDYRRALYEVLRMLSTWHSWERTDSTEGAQVAAVWREALDRIDWNASLCDGEGFECSDYTPDAPFITWLPQNPFTQPEYTPPGYFNPPFYVVDEGLLPNILGARVGDVLTDYTRFITDITLWEIPTIIEQGFPRFEIHVEGRAEVELHLLQVPQGGLALIQVDGDPARLQIVALDSIGLSDWEAALENLFELFNIGVENDEFILEEIIEIELEEEGEHVIEVAFLPQIDADVLIGIGGGLRSVTICRDDDMDVRQNPTEPCKLEKRSNPYEAWQEFADLQLCPPKLRQNPTTGELEYSTDDGETWSPIETPIPERAPSEDNLCLAAANAVLAIEAFSEELQSRFANTSSVVALAIVAAAFLVALVLTPIAWFGLIPAISGLLVLAGFGSTNFNDNDRDDLQCLLYCRAYDNLGQPRFDHEGVIADLIDDGRPIFAICRWLVEMMGADGLNRAGAVTAITEADCDFCDCDEWCYTFDFTTSDHDFGDGSGRMIWVSGSGWQRNPSSIHTSVSITKVFTATVTYVSMEYEGAIGGINQAFFATQDDADFHPITSTESPAEWAFAGGLPCDIQTRFGADADSLDTDITITRITLHGTGTNPFGTNNCE